MLPGLTTGMLHPVRKGRTNVGTIRSRTMRLLEVIRRIHHRKKSLRLGERSPQRLKAFSGDSSADFRVYNVGGSDRSERNEPRLTGKNVGLRVRPAPRRKSVKRSRRQPVAECTSKWRAIHASSGKLNMPRENSVPAATIFHQQPPAVIHPLAPPRHRRLPRRPPNRDHAPNQRM